MQGLSVLSRRLAMRPLACALGTLMISVVSAASKDLDRDLLETAFEFIPDAWQLINSTELKFHLMFVSKVFKNGEYSCLTTIKTENVEGNPWQKTLVYSTFPDSRTMTISRSLLEVKKTRNCYVYDDAFMISNSGGKQETRGRFKVIYADIETCILLKSPYLGYQVWASKSYVEMHNEIPYICVLLYEIYAGLKKYWVYDWDTCPQRKIEI
uniref:Lipocalin/cytosolic fatty-acid binding domain-containing protein n=1 Tax=Amblyomma maculatum TaxID=34609 RepID=G3MRM1_AMBMU